MFRTGQNVRVLDQHNAYRGRVGRVICIAVYGGVQILTVGVPTGAGGEVTFALRETEAEAA